MAFFYTSSCSNDTRVLCLLDITLILCRFSYVHNLFSRTYGVLVSCLLQILWILWRFSLLGVTDFFGVLVTVILFLFTIFFFCSFFLNHHSCEAKNTMTIMSWHVQQNGYSEVIANFYCLFQHKCSQALGSTIFSGQISFLYGFATNNLPTVYKLRGRIDKIQILVL